KARPANKGRKGPPTNGTAVVRTAHMTIPQRSACRTPNDVPAATCVHRDRVDSEVPLGPMDPTHAELSAGERSRSLAAQSRSACRHRYEKREHTMSTDQNKAIARRIVDEAWTKHAPSILDTLFSSDAI